MAEGLRFVCTECHKAIEAWSDGNPYYLDEAGAKHYAYHPDHEAMARCIGNDSPPLCLGCGKELTIDSRAPLEACPGCGSRRLVDTFRLAGRRCPFCKTGKFSVDRDFRCIS